MPHVKGGARRRRSSEATRARLQAAAAHLLASEGYAAATTRAIGAEAGCDAALVAYHYGSLNALLLAVLNASNASRLEAYRDAVGRASNRRELVRALQELYEEDRRSGHTAVLAQLVAGGLMDRDLGREVARRMQPWVEVTAATLRAHLPAAVRRHAPARELAYAAVAGFLGLELLDALLGDQAEGSAVMNAITRWRPWRARTASDAGEASS